MQNFKQILCQMWRTDLHMLDATVTVTLTFNVKKNLLPLTSNLHQFCSISVS